VAAIVAHSMGALATVLAIEAGLRVPRAVFIAPAASPDAAARRFARFFGLGETTLQRMRADVERRLELPWDAVDALSRAYLVDTDVLIYHDRDDADVPLAEGAALASAIPGAALITVTGLGHRRILRDPQVVAGAARHVE